MSELSDVVDAVDVHCHLFQAGDGTKGFIHPKWLNSLSARMYFRVTELITTSELLFSRQIKDLEKFNEKYIELMIDKIEKSRLKHTVLLPLDGVYNNGYLDKEKTLQYVTNDVVMDVAKESSKILPAGSINPLRRDWEDELKKCIEGKVALIKWLPSVMGFDPSDKKIEKFYERLAEEKIPILSHVGFEWAISTINKDYSNLDRIRLPLEMGVTIIAAHCCGGVPFVDHLPFIDKPNQFKKVVEAVKKYPNLYLDVAAMSSPHRKSRLKRAIKNEYTHERLVFGTDYPIPYLKCTSPTHLGVKDYLMPGKNYFDTDMKIKESMGLNESDLSRGYKVLNQKALHS